MTDECAREFEIVEAAAHGRLTPSQREHTAGCAVCREAVTVTAALRDLAGRTAAEAPEHSYRVAWLAAQFAARQERLARFDFLSAACLGAVAAFGVAGLTILLAPKFLDAVRTTVPAALGDMGLLMIGMIVVAGCVGIWALWDRKLGSR